MSQRLFKVLPACTAALAALLAYSADASAQGSESWRRHTGPRPKSTLGNFTFELRFGGYYPQIDEEFNGAATPFADFFGKGPQFYFGLEVDWLPIAIPYVGKLGPGFGWGYTKMNTKAKPLSTSADGATVAVDTSIDIHDMNLSAVLRIDEISKRIVVPIVPYAKLGFGMGSWSSGTTGGSSKVGDCTTGTSTTCVTADGMSIGPHLAFGGMLGLNWLDRRAGSMAREGTGIDQAYLFGEWMLDKLDSGVGKSAMHVGTSSWVVGLALDL